jgi:hypothetical protein
MHVEVGTTLDAGMPVAMPLVSTFNALTSNWRSPPSGPASSSAQTVA